MKTKNNFLSVLLSMLGQKLILNSKAVSVSFEAYHFKWNIWPDLLAKISSVYFRFHCLH